MPVRSVSRPAIEFIAPYQTVCNHFVYFIHSLGELLDALAGLLARGLKVAAGRARPSVKQELGWNGPHLSAKYNSFPSGHTAATSAFFGVLFFAHRRVGLSLIAIPLLIAASRMYVGAHFLSDVVCGALIGILCAWLCARGCLPAPIGPES